MKLENDKLKVDCDVEKRTFEMKLANEMEQTKKYQGIYSFNLLNNYRNVLQQFIWI